jgi:hypothetical protein
MLGLHLGDQPAHVNAGDLVKAGFLRHVAGADQEQQARRQHQ